ncbi:MAG: response regulator [Deltaproteobacteria bacterium]|nr:response regulator [Deltaproteobacteria bacterium]
MKPYRILMVEDEEHVLNPAQRQLREAGYSVDVAEDGMTALGLWERLIYDVLIIDLRIPRLDGMELIKKIKAKQPYTQIVIVSGLGEEEDFINAINQHVFAYLKKPVDLDVFLSTIEKAVRERDMVLITLERLAERAAEDSQLLVGQKQYSAQELYDEVRKGSELGNEFREELEKSLTDFEMPDQSTDEMLGIKGIF